MQIALSILASLLVGFLVFAAGLRLVGTWLSGESVSGSSVVAAAGMMIVVTVVGHGFAAVLGMGGLLIGILVWALQLAIIKATFDCGWILAILIDLGASIMTLLLAYLLLWIGLIPLLLWPVGGPTLVV